MLTLFGPVGLFIRTRWDWNWNWTRIACGKNNIGPVLGEWSEMDRTGLILNIYWTDLILNLQLDHLFTQQLVLVSFSILIYDFLDSFGESFSYDLGYVPGGRSTPNYGNLYLDGRISIGDKSQNSLVISNSNISYFILQCILFKLWLCFLIFLSKLPLRLRIFKQMIC